MKPTPAQIEKLILDNPQLHVFDLSKLLGMTVNEASRVRRQAIVNQARRLAETFENLEFLGRKQ